MSIGHDVYAALPELRAQAESLMTDRCVIDRLATVWDEAQQKSVTTWVVVADDVPCAFVDESAAARSLVADEAATPAAPVVKVSVSVVGVKPDDRVTLASGAVVWVTHVPDRTNQVQRRIQCRRVK